MIQMATLHLNRAVYLVGQPVKPNTQGRLMYTVFVHAPPSIMEEFYSAIIDTFNGVLWHFKTSTKMNELMEKPPASLSTKEVNLIQSRRPFFAMTRTYVTSNMYFGFPPCSVIKTIVQSLYISLKGGLDSNLQQFQSPIHNGFEQKYVIHLMLSIVTNTRRAHQLLNQAIEYDIGFSMHWSRKALANNCLSLTDFNHTLSMALIQSSSDP